MKRIMSKEEFLSVYERQQASGLTIKDFCENEAYSSSCFHYWKILLSDKNFAKD